MEQKLIKININDRIDYIKNAALSASALGIENLIIESNMVRGIDEAKVVMIIQENDVKMPFTALGINRLDVFKTRLQLFETQTGVNFEAHLHPETKEVVLLQMKAPGLSIDYRCAHCIEPNPTIKAPRTMKSPIKFEFQMNEETIELLAKGHHAMGGDKLTLSANAEGVQVKTLDSSNDEFVQTIATAFVNKETGKKNDGEFEWMFASKTFLNMLKNATHNTFGVNEAGVFKGISRNLGTYIVHMM